MKNISKVIFVLIEILKLLLMLAGIIAIVSVFIVPVLADDTYTCDINLTLIEKTYNNLMYSYNNSCDIWNVSIDEMDYPILNGYIVLSGLKGNSSHVTSVTSNEYTEIKIDATLKDSGDNLNDFLFKYLPIIIAGILIVAGLFLSPLLPLAGIIILLLEISINLKAFNPIDVIIMIFLCIAGLLAFRFKVD